MINVIAKSIYTPQDWYWLKQDGAIYSSKQQALVTETDAGYEAFLARGNKPSSFPTDTEGNDSDQELAKVLAPYGLRAFPSPMAQLKQSFLRFLPGNSGS